MSQRLARSSASVLVTRLFMLLAGVLTSVIVARTLGPDGLGKYVALVTVITLVLNLADLGIRQAVTYTMGQRAFANEAIVSTVLLLLVATSVMSVLAAAAVLLSGPARTYGLAWIPALAAIPFLLATSYARGVSLANGWIGRFNYVGALERASIVALLLVALVGLKLGLTSAMVAYASGAMIGAVYSFMVMRRMGRLRIAWHPKIARRLVSLGAIYAVTLFVLNLNYRIDILLLERLTSADSVGLYGVGVRLAELVWQVPAAVGIVLFSASAQETDVGVAVRRTTHVLRVSLPVTILACAALYLLAPPLITLAFGPDFGESVTVVRWLLPGIAAAVIFKILNADLAGRGQPAHAFWVYSFVAVLNVGLNLWLIPRFDIVGAAAASTVSYAVGGLWFASSYARLHALPLARVLIATPRDFEPIVNAVLRRSSR